MNKHKANMFGLMILTLTGCIIMAIIETVMEPAYVVKSAIKTILFLFVPFVFIKAKNETVFQHSFVLNKKRFAHLIALGTIIYVVIVGGYILTKTIFDYRSLVSSLSADQKVSADNFIWVALYISFCNSFLEEFLFRFIAFIKLSEYTAKTIAYIFSSAMFAAYHIAMIGTSFPVPLLLLALIGLAAGGAIFNYIDDKNKTIYNSWIIHMFADFAIMTIWYIHI